MQNLLTRTEAFTKRYARHYKFPDSEELFSEALVAITRGLIEAKKQTIIDLNAYLHAWIRNRCRAIIDRRKMTVELHPECATYKPDYTVETIEAMKLTEKQREILDLLLEGYNEPEVALLTGVCQQRVSQQRAEIRKKYAAIQK